MSVPLSQKIRVGAYVMKQRLLGRDCYPLVLMLEPLFSCDLVCPSGQEINISTGKHHAKRHATFH